MIVSFAQNFEDVMLWRALKHVDRGFYIDVGANDPSIDSVTRLFYDRGWRGINIEPLKHHWLELERARPRDLNLQCAAGPSEGVIELWECGVRGWATADSQAVQAHQARGRTGQYMRVPMSTLALICKTHAPEDIHFLKVDVEGFECAVLQGMDFVAYRPWIVLVEATRPNTTIEVYQAWEGILTEAGYVHVYADGLNRFYIACERETLLGAFKYPPNFFDGFVTSSQLDAQTRAEFAQGCIDQALARATQAEAQVAALLGSTSWRVTAPLRRAMKVRELFSRRMVFGPVAAAKNQIRRVLHSSNLRAMVLPALDRFPRLKARVKALRDGTTNSPVDELAHLPLRVRKAYAELCSLASHGQCQNGSPADSSQRRLKLAYVSPLPPQRSGIADYSAELISALSTHYKVDVIVDDLQRSDLQIPASCEYRSVTDFLEHSQVYDRVLYHFGNSALHSGMFQMLDKVPGVVVLHDFYLGGVLESMEQAKAPSFALLHAIYASHGYRALIECAGVTGKAGWVAKYPANLPVMQGALSVVVHSEHSRNLADQWYGEGTSVAWSVIPVLRAPPAVERSDARQILGLSADDFVVCSFGLMAPPKLNHRLLDSWLMSPLASNEKCSLIFVGEENAGEYGRQVRRVIESCGVSARIRILGWTDMALFSRYLAAADVAVQLRSQSRGESSAAVLDCMNNGLATIVNAHGSLAELPSEAVMLLPDLFDNSQLSDALEYLWRNGVDRQALGMRARRHVQEVHSPQKCAVEYVQALDAAYSSLALERQGRLDRLSKVDGTPTSLVELAKAVVRAQPSLFRQKQWLIDVSGTCRSDPKTGIQRVVRALVWELIRNPPSGSRAEPVYLSDKGGRWHYRYARAWTLESLGYSKDALVDSPAEFGQGDVLLIADFISELASRALDFGVYEDAKLGGASIHFLVYDLLPLSMPHCFPPNQFGYTQWLDSLSRVADGALCISESVANDLLEWMVHSGPVRSKPLVVDWFHLGANILETIPTRGLHPDASRDLTNIADRPSFLMVGTLEPRKGYLQALDAFTLLWDSGVDINLVIVGREGWTDLPDRMRRTIPEIMKRLRGHPELGRRLIWLDGISDEFLDLVYAGCQCLIAASEGEGFGLPLIEAAQHGIPIIARDIPVFREVAAENVFFFEASEPAQMADAVKEWIGLNARNLAPQSSGMSWLTWEESAFMLVQKVEHFQ